MTRALPTFAATLLAAVALAACSSQATPGGARHPGESAKADGAVASIPGGAAKSGDDGWASYGGDPGGRRYSQLTQISPANVGRL
ncbi:MAG: PQQ-dependent dehydrogenase, methanol/ethanol family, partial [Steroidobacteraceae bacterium]